MRNAMMQDETLKDEARAAVLKDDVRAVLIQGETFERGSDGGTL